MMTSQSVGMKMTNQKSSNHLELYKNEKVSFNSISDNLFKQENVLSTAEIQKYILFQSYSFFTHYCFSTLGVRQLLIFKVLFHCNNEEELYYFVRVLAPISSPQNWNLLRSSAFFNGKKQLN